jgi:hypothetical protein
MTKKETKILVVGVAAFIAIVVIIWGVSTHGFKDMRSYNLGYNAGLTDKNSRYPAGCLTMLLLALESSDAPGLDQSDFNSGCKDSGDWSGIRGDTGGR